MPSDTELIVVSFDWGRPSDSKGWALPSYPETLASSGLAEARDFCWVASWDNHRPQTVSERMEDTTGVAQGFRRMARGCCGMAQDFNCTPLGHFPP